MRLICPNCDAEYEVDDAAIPSSGRDVQCSSCGHAWFQGHPQVQAEAEDEAELFGTPEADAPSAVDWEPEDILARAEGTAPDAPAELGQAERDLVEPERVDRRQQDRRQTDRGQSDRGQSDRGQSDRGQSDRDPQDGGEQDRDLQDRDPQDGDPQDGGQPEADLDTPSPVSEAAPEGHEIVASEAEPELQPDPQPEPLRRSIDESVLAVLREEAEREAAARRGERPRLETQTEMTLPESPRSFVSRPAVARPSASRLSVSRPVADPLAAAVPPVPLPAATEAAAVSATSAAIEAPSVTIPGAPRKRELLPAIEEIKSSLNPTLDPEEETFGGLSAPPRNGFGLGFVLVALVAVVLLAVYVMAPLISETVPTLRGPVATYVDTVNDLRRALDGQLQAVIGWLRGLAGGSAG